MDRKRLIIAITGASGVIYGIRVLQVLSSLPSIEVHLIISEFAKKNIELETKYEVFQIENLADKVYNYNDLSSPIASGSFLIDGMIIAPCTIKTMASIAYSINDNLITRAADVCLKERRKLVLMIRETPFHLGHLKTMVRLSEMGAIIFPPVPSFYYKPKSIDDIVNHTVGRVLDLFGIHIDISRWGAS